MIEPVSAGEIESGVTLHSFEGSGLPGATAHCGGHSQGGPACLVVEDFKSVNINKKVKTPLGLHFYFTQFTLCLHLAQYNNYHESYQDQT